MRKHWILSCFLSASVVGCAGPGLVSGGGQFAGHPQAEQLAALQSGGSPQASWTQKVTGALTGKSGNQSNGSASHSRKVLDPLSIGFASGPPNAALYLSMARMSDQGGNSAHARSMYHRALTIEPKNLEGMLGLARLEDREGELDAAMHYYQQAVQMHPHSAKALNDLSLCYARRGQLREAVSPLEQAICMEPSKQLYRNNIAKVLTELNQIDGAVRHLSAVHSPAVAHYNMGVLLHQRGRSEEAVRFLATATQADPSLVAASTLLAELTGAGQRVDQGHVAQGSAAMQNAILPTPGSSLNQAYPSTGVVSASRPFQTVPAAETAQRPVGHSPALMTPVR